MNSGWQTLAPYKHDLYDGVRSKAHYSTLNLFHWSDKKWDDVDSEIQTVAIPFQVSFAEQKEEENTLLVPFKNLIYGISG